MDKIVHIIGARPHFMKLAPIYHLAHRQEHWDQAIIHTGQHYDFNLSGSFLEEFDLPGPDHDLDVGSGSHLHQMGRMLIKLDDVLQREKPDIVFVYGDTNSTAAGAIAAAKRNVTLAHIEAGLREFDKSIPEEVNKLLTDAVADLMFCPTQTSVQNISNAGRQNGVHLVGDVVVDLLMQHDGDFSGDVMTSAVDQDYVFMTCHRAVNTDSKANLTAILEAAAALDLRVVFPMHPRTRQAVKAFGLESLLRQKHFDVRDPVGFWETQRLIKAAHAVITDSGGVIREAYFHKTPCAIVDRQTEWVEAVDEGWAHVVGPDRDKIVSTIRNISVPERQSGFLGDGKAAERILEITRGYLEGRVRGRTSRRLV